MSVKSSATFGTYLGEIDRTPLLSATEEREMAARVLSGDAEARDRMVRANLRLVVNIARGYAGKGLSLDDLVAEGNLGLMRAVESFDPNMNTRFSTYAAFWVKQSLKRAVVNTARPVRIPAHANELLTKWRRATNKLTDEFGRAPTQEEVAQFLGLSKKKVALIQKAIRIASAGSQADAGEEDWGIEEVLADSRGRGPGEELGAAEHLRQVMQYLAEMESREATVLRMRFGLDGEEPKTLKEIGDRLGLTRERVRQIENGALAKLAERVGRSERPAHTRLVAGEYEHRGIPRYQLRAPITRPRRLRISPTL